MRDSKSLAMGAEFGMPFHPHWKILIWPFAKAGLLLAAVLALLVLTGFGHGYLVLPLLLGAVAVAGLARWVLYPVLEWRATSWKVTHTRLRVRWGVVTREEVDLTMSRLIDVSLKTTPLDGLFGTGTLILEFPGRRGEVRMRGVPFARDWNILLNEILDGKKKAATP